MYAYFYDAFLQDRRYERDLAELETRLTDLGIMGKITRLALFRDGVDVIRDAIEEGSETLVAVGNDRTLQLAIDAVGEGKTTIGYLPINHKQSFLADLLGIPAGVEACEVLSARLVEKIDLGEVNGRRFLHAVEGELHEPTISCDEAYSLRAVGRATVAIRNLALPDDAGVTDPIDGRLDLIVRQTKFSLFKKRPRISHLRVQHLRIETTKHTTLIVDGGEKIQSQRFDIRSMPGRLHLITGKNRQF